ncbi:hypothetical protein D3C76_1758600 [compost metagenome]
MASIRLSQVAAGPISRKVSGTVITRHSNGVTKLRNALCNTRLNSGSRRQDTQAAKMIGITDEL